MWSPLRWSSCFTKLWGCRDRPLPYHWPQKSVRSQSKHSPVMQAAQQHISPRFFKVRSTIFKNTGLKYGRDSLALVNQVAACRQLNTTIVFGPEEGVRRVDAIERINITASLDLGIVIVGESHVRFSRFFWLSACHQPPKNTKYRKLRKNTY